MIIVKGLLLALFTPLLLVIVDAVVKEIKGGNDEGQGSQEDQEGDAQALA